MLYETDKKFFNNFQKLFGLNFPLPWLSSFFSNLALKPFALRENIKRLKKSWVVFVKKTTFLSKLNFFIQVFFINRNTKYIEYFVSDFPLPEIKINSKVVSANCEQDK